MSRVGIVMTALVLSTAGCAHRTAATPAHVVAYQPGGPAATVPVPARAVYALHGGAGEAPAVTRYLAAGEAIGFERGADGTVQAAAGRERWPLADGPHDWRVDANESKRVRGEKAEQVAGAVYDKVDKVADVVGKVLYPPLFIASFPFHFLAGGQGGKIL